MYKNFEFIYPEGKGILLFIFSHQVRVWVLKNYGFGRWVGYGYPLSYTHGWGKKWVCIFLFD